MTAGSIGDETGCFNGAEFESAEEVRAYFTVENFKDMAGVEPNEDQETLDAWAETIIEDGFGCAWIMRATDKAKTLIYDANTKEVDITVLYDEANRVRGFGPLNDSALERLDLDDVTHDSRWFKSRYEGSGDRLGVYKDEEENLWEALYMEASKQIVLRFVTQEQILQSL
jgi:hypothetical protein